MARSASRLFPRALLVVALLLALVPLGSSPTGASSSHMALDFFHLVNEERRARGLSPVRAHPEMVARADRWSAQMAATGRMQHSRQQFTTDATWAAENVGYTTNRDARELHEGFMASSTHRDNILDSRATFVGLGVAEGHGRLWVTHQFSNATR